MAIMYPDPINSLSSIPQSERKIYECLKNNLNNEIIVFHGVRLSSKKDQEIDFVIVNPKYGIIILEVKGGQINYDGKKNQWTSKDKKGEFHEIDPINQSIKNHYEFRKRLQKAEITKKYTYRTHWAVCFSDVAIPKDYESLSLPKDKFISIDDLDNIQKRLNDFYDFHIPRRQGITINALSRESIDALTDLLARSWEFQSPLFPLIEIISRDDRQRKQYTEEQFQLLDFLDRHNEALICGCAGSGKTFLAAEKARRLAQEGYRVGFLCWNNKLASWLKQKMNNINGVYIDTVTKFIQTNYSYQFDALIVDEAQDIPGNDDWQLILNKLIHEGILYIFYDDNQKIFNKDKKLSFPIKKNPYILTKNCRNTDKVHNLTLNFYRSSNKLPTALIQSPKDPEIKYCDNGIESMMLDILDKLIVDEKINPQNIILLTPRKGKSKYKQISGKAPKVSDWSPAKLINEKYLIYHGQENLQAYKSANKGLKSKNYIEIECSTIQTFKGLEKQVVIVTEIDSLIFQSNFNEVLYVGLSRCQSHLIILFQEESSLIKFNEICNHI